MYNAFQFTVNAVAAFSGGAYSSLKQGPPACFVAGTMILTVSGMVAIEKIKAGDKVISTNPDTFETAEKTVLETYVREVSQLIHLTINKELITTTVDHPFYVKKRGFINASKLYVEDKVMDAVGGSYKVDGICVEVVDNPEKVYNFQVEEFHTYHVGSTRVLVHNAEGYLDAKIEDTPELIESNNKTPSEIAKSWQGSGKYPGIDDYTDVTVDKGTILYRGEPNGTEYFTTLDAIESSGRNATTIFEGLQVEKNPIHGYRGEMQGYLFNEDIACAYGITTANPQFGAGGLPQYYVPDVQELIEKGILTLADNIKLYK